MKKVYTIVLNWNGLQDTIECLTSLNNINYKNHHIIIVDNGSTDGSSNKLSNEFPQHILIKNDSNLGFAEGNNIGINLALKNGADYVFLLNNDTIVDPNIIDEFIQFSTKNPNVGILNPKIYYYNSNVIWSAGGYWDNKNKCFEQFGENELDIGQHDNVRPIDFAVGCALFMPSSTIEIVGYLDNDFFLNYEEIDYCYRAKKINMDIFYTPKAMVWHKVSASFGSENSPLKVYYTFRNRLLWAKKHLNLSQKASVHLSVYYIVLIKITKQLCLSNPKAFYWSLRGCLKNHLLRAMLYGIKDYWTGKLGECGENVYRLQIKWKRSLSK